MAGSASKPSDLGVEDVQASTRSDRLRYLADMLLEMKTLAENDGCITLAGLLSLAYFEARQRVREGGD